MEIVVTGRGLDAPPAQPAYGSVELPRDDLLTAASGRLEDALQGVAGFQQFRRSDSRSANPSAQGVTLRALGGNATSRALVLLDGVPMADPFFGYIPLSALAPERLARAVVTRGGGSGPFGSGALAGTIELESAGAEELGFFEGQAALNDRGETELSGSLAPLVGAGFAVLSGRWDRGDGFWTTPESQRVPASVRAAFESWSVQGRGVAPLAPGVDLQARVLLFRDARTLRFSGADSLSEGQDASVRVVGRGRWAFDALAYVQGRDFANVVVGAARFLPVLDQRKTPSLGMGGKFELRPPVGRSDVLRLGIDYRLADGSLLEEALAHSGAVAERRRAGGRNGNLGLFVEHDRRFGPVTLTGGVRADRYTIRDGFFRSEDGAGQPLQNVRYQDRAGWQGSVRAGVLWSVGPGVRLRAAAYTGLRLPTLNELYRPFVVFPVTTLANPDLRNERLLGYETGAEFRRGGLHVSVTAFVNRIEDAIANVTLERNLRQRRNIAAIEAQGVEAEWRMETGPFEVRGSATFTDARARGRDFAASLDGRRPAQTPRWAGSGTLRYAPADGFVAAATLRHVGAQFEDDLETDRLPAATTLDAFAQIALRPGLSLVARAENLTGETIVTRNAAGSIDLGVPRTLWLGLRWGGREE